MVLGYCVVQWPFSVVVVVTVEYLVSAGGQYELGHEPFSVVVLTLVMVLVLTAVDTTVVVLSSHFVGFGG